MDDSKQLGVRPAAEQNEVPPSCLVEWLKHEKIIRQQALKKVSTFSLAPMAGGGLNAPILHVIVYHCPLFRERRCPCTRGSRAQPMNLKGTCGIG